VLTLTGAPIPLPTVVLPEAFAQRLRQMQIVLHNQDNREHDLLDSDDYYQFQGGLTAAVRALTGKNPQTYFGDHSNPENPPVRQLRAEWRVPVVNPVDCWVMRHGYKGAFEMAATVDYLPTMPQLGVEDHMYQESRRRTCSTHLCRRSFKKEPLGFARYGRLLKPINAVWQDADQEMVDEYDRSFTKPRLRSNQNESR